VLGFEVSHVTSLYSTGRGSYMPILTMIMLPILKTITRYYWYQYQDFKPCY